MSENEICVCGEGKDLYRHITGWKCDNCLDELIKKKVDKFYENKTDTEYRDKVICPNCGYEHGKSLETFGDMTGAEIDKYECHFCLKHFYVAVQFEVEFTPNFTTWLVEGSTGREWLTITKPKNPPTEMSLSFRLIGDDEENMEMYMWYKTIEEDGSLSALMQAWFQCETTNDRDIEGLQL